MTRRPAFARLLPILIALVLGLPLLAGCTDVAGIGEDDASASLLPMTLTEWLFPPDMHPGTTDPVGIAHLSITPMQPGENDLVVALTDLDGAPLALDAGADPTLTWHLLAPDAPVESATLTPEADAAATWRVDDVELGDQGWYAFDVAMANSTSPIATSTLYALLPDPSVHGASALDLPESSPDAAVLYERTLAAYGGWKTGKWRESLGSGTDVLVVTQYAVTSTDDEPAAMSSSSVFAGSFRPKADGDAPGPVQRDFAKRIAIGDRWWSRAPGGWSEASGQPVSGFPERADIYTGATNIQLGGTETVNGITTEVITFYLPEKQGQSEAWFAWWVDPETGDPVRIAMIARMHFMIWDFYDVNVPTAIDPPAGGSATPAAAPPADARTDLQAATSPHS